MSCVFIMTRLVARIHKHSQPVLMLKVDVETRWSVQNQLLVIIISRMFTESLFLKAI